MRCGTSIPYLQDQNKPLPRDSLAYGTMLAIDMGLCRWDMTFINRKWRVQSLQATEEKEELQHKP